MKKLSAVELRKLSALALQAKKNAYAPYSNHPVGAALITDKGKTFSGGNSESANYDCIHAEGAAISAMTTAGERKIRAIVVVGPGLRYVATPCGSCRQRIREFSDKNTVIYALRSDGKSGRMYRLDQILPDSFGPENLAEVGLGPLAGKKKQTKKKKK